MTLPSTVPPPPPAPPQLRLSLASLTPARTTAAQPEQPSDGAGDDTGRLLRPYAITGGRTVAPATLNLETQLRRTDHAGGTTAHRWEAARVIQMAERPIAVVEVAARTGLPVGVAKVVIADLIEEGALATGPLPAETSFSSLLEKVLDGLDRI